jgi:hypothetical protein
MLVFLILSHHIKNHIIPFQVACDRCQKWRRVSLRVSKSIESSAALWFCEDNDDDPAFASCDVAEQQEEDDDTALEGDVGEESHGVEAAQVAFVVRPRWVLALEEAFALAFTVSRNPHHQVTCSQKK